MESCRARRPWAVAAPPLPRSGVLLLLGALAAAIVLGAPPAAADDGAGVVRHGAAVSAANALIVELQVSLTSPARVYVEYDNPQAGRYRTAPSEPATEHTIPIVRLRPETTYDYTIFAAAGQDRPAAGGRFTTGRLPPRLAAMPARVRGRSTQPLILSDYLRGDGWTYLLFWDETGSVVWYYHAPTFLRKTVKQSPGGTLFVLENGSITEITPLGEVVTRFERREPPERPHHELTVLDDGRVIYPSREVVIIDDSVNGGGAVTRFRVDNLSIWDPASGRVEQVWEARSAWDILDPNQRVEREDANNWFSWTPINSVSIGPRGNVILSVRGRNQVVSLSPDLSAVEWQLHGPDSDYEFPNPADRFYGQHTAAQLANGNVLLFDNGWTRPEAEGGKYSRALELRLDAAAGTAVKVWEYRLTPDYYAPSNGSAYRLRNGNTLVNFTRSGLNRPMIVVEADAAGNEVFRFENLPWSQTAAQIPIRYRAYGGIASIMGETMLRPPAGAYAPAHVETAADGFTMAADPAKFRELAAAVDGAPRIAANGPFDLYLADGRLVYAKEPCAPEDVAERFFLQVFPAAAGGGGLDFWFVEHGQRWQGACLAAVTLPDYEAARIRTGQLNDWSVEFPAAAGTPRSRAGPGR